MSNTPIIGRYARIIMDRWFKRAFGSESRKRLLLLFLQELIPEHRIVELTYANTEHTSPVEGKKDVRIDVECTDSDGTRFVVEVQVAEQQHFYERAVFNSTLAIQQQKGKGEEDYDFPTVYFVGLMDFSKHPGSGRVDYRFTIRERETNELMTPRIQYIFLELPNSLDKALKPGASVLENFCYALHQMEHLTERPVELKQEIFQLLFDSAEIAKFTPKEKAQYELDMTTERDIRNQIKFAEKKGLEKGLAEGLVKGREEGRAEGRAEGREEGRAEGRAEGAREKAIETARAFLKMGISAETVAAGTGLSMEEVQAIARDLEVESQGK